MEIRENLMAHGHKWYKFLIGAYKRSNRQLAALCKQELPRDKEDKLQYVDAIMEFRRQDALLKEHITLGRELFGSRWQKSHTDWPALQEVTNYITELHTRVSAGACPPQVIAWLHNNRNAAEAVTDQQ